MRILITSGGTKIPIDSVRSITNMSSGTFGAKLGREAINRGHELHFLTHKDGKTPFKRMLDMNSIQEQDLNTELMAIGEHVAWCERHIKYYKEKTYDDYTDYMDGLGQLLLENKYDAIILAAAVSDYGVEPVEGKIRTKHDLTLTLYPLTKIISKIRDAWWDGFEGVMVGFKLLVDVPSRELVESAQDSIMLNGCDFVVANDLRDIKAGDHKVILVSRDKVEYSSKNTAAVDIITKVEKLHKERNKNE